jgi:hypothetical protein
MQQRWRVCIIAWHATGGDSGGADPTQHRAGHIAVPSAVSQPAARYRTPPLCRSLVAAAMACQRSESAWLS